MLCLSIFCDKYKCYVWIYIYKREKKQKHTPKTKHTFIIFL